MFLRRQGSDDAAPAVAFGSHLDTVPIHDNWPSSLSPDGQIIRGCGTADMKAGCGMADMITGDQARAFRAQCCLVA